MICIKWSTKVKTEMSDMSCGICGKKEDIPHTCSYCGGIYCDEHHHPENHNCYKMSIKNWDTHQAYEIAKGNVPQIPEEFHAIKEATREGWTDIADYDPNTKESPFVHTDKSLIDSAGKHVDQKESPEPKNADPASEFEYINEKKCIMYNGRWMTFYEYTHMDSKKEIKEKATTGKPSFLTKLLEKIRKSK